MADGVYHGRKLRGGKAWRLTQLLAAGERTLTSLAEEFEVTIQGITNFRDGHLEEIERLRSGLRQEFEGLWIADKEARVREYETQVDRINEWLSEPESVDATVVGLVKAQQTALDAVARETGQLVGKAEVKLNYSVEGIDPGTLQ